MGPPEGLVRRPVRETDADALVGLVGTVYAEYPGCVLDLDGVDADLLAPRSTFATKGGELWVVERAGQPGIVACCGWGPGRDPRMVELKRLYVRPAARGAGLGTWLVGEVEAVARQRGAAEVELWSDTRFAAAHRLYERLGYTATGTTRALHDPSHTTERHYRKPLDAFDHPPGRQRRPLPPQGGRHDRD